MSKIYLLACEDVWKDVVVTAYPSKTAAETAKAASAAAQNWLVSEEADLAQFSLHDLALIYEGITGTPITRFKDLATGKRRVFTVIKAEVERQEAEANPGSAGSAEEGAAVAKSTKKAVAKKKAPAPKGDRKFISRDAKLKVILRDNPRREGTRSFKVYALMQDGMTVGEWLKKGGHMQDLRHDIKLGRVALES